MFTFTGRRVLDPNVSALGESRKLFEAFSHVFRPSLSALFVIPLLTILGWILDKPLSLLFDPFISVSLFLSVLIVNQTVQDGKSNVSSPDSLTGA